MANKKTTSKTVFIFIVGSIVGIMVLAYLFRPPLRMKKTARPPATAPSQP